MKEAQFTVMLTSEDRYRHHHVRFRRNILSFVVQYETRLEGKWLPVVRYDTRHGFAHRDLLDKKGKKLKTPMFTDDYSEALTFAECDIQSNWRIYKQRFLKELDMETQNNQFFARNSELSIEFSKYVLEHPEMDDLLTEETIVVFLPEFDVELREFNLKMAKEIESDGGKPLYVKVKQMAHKVSSRLIGVEVGREIETALAL